MLYEPDDPSGRVSRLGRCLAVTAALANDLQRWIGDAEQHDDFTFVVMKVR